MLGRLSCILGRGHGTHASPLPSEQTSWRHRASPVRGASFLARGHGLLHSPWTQSHCGSEMCHAAPLDVTLVLGYLRWSVLSRLLCRDSGYRQDPPLWTHVHSRENSYRHQTLFLVEGERVPSEGGF